MARFVVEYLSSNGPHREVHVTSDATASLNGTALRNGAEIQFRGHRWEVAHLEDGGDDRYVLTPIDA